MTPAPKTRIYLENRPTITRIVPELAVAIGLNESILLLQFDFWIGQSSNYEDGRYWTYQSLRDMQEKAFAYMGLATINRAVQSLEEQKLIIVGNYNKRKGDNTRWFALDPEGLRKLAERVPCIVVADTLIQNETPPSQQGGGAFQNGSPSDQNGSTLPETTTESLDQDKEVVVASDAFFHPVFLEVTNTPAPQALPVPTQREPADADFIIELFTDYFGDRFAPTRQAVLSAVMDYTFVEVRHALEEAKVTNKSGVVQWAYVQSILERRYQQHLDRVSAFTPHDQLLGMRRGYQPETPEDSMIYTHPLWVAFRERWQAKTTVAPNIPPLSVKRYADTARALERMGVTTEQIGRLVDRVLAKKRTEYKFEFAVGDINAILTEDAMQRQQRDPKLVEAACMVWKATAGDFVNGILDILSSLDTPITSEEITRFGAWYAAQPQFKNQAKPPSSADSLIKRVHEFRAQQQVIRANAAADQSSAYRPSERYTPTPEELAERRRMSEEARKSAERTAV